VLILRPDLIRPVSKARDVGAAIKARRLERGLGLRQTATLCGVSAPYLSRIERNAQRNPSEGAIVRIAVVLALDAAVLMRLAGRISSETVAYLTQDAEMPVFIRRAMKLGLSGADLLAMLDVRYTPLSGRRVRARVGAAPMSLETMRGRVAPRAPMR
jgi:transcriptional regulator with XRE-family HTH domain